MMYWLDRYFNSLGVLLIAFILYVAVVALRDDPYVTRSIDVRNAVLVTPLRSSVPHE